MSTSGSPARRPLRPELVCPGGSPFKLETAFRYGADAVYLSGPRYSLRCASNAFDTQKLEWACGFAHERDRKVYVTLNGYLFDKDMGLLKAHVQALEAMGVDAVVISDTGVLHTVTRCSRIPIHISTQASVSHAEAAGFWRDLGAQRVILARELSIAEARHIREAAGIEVEVFVHGAMCFSVSGHCSWSTFVAGRDSNRGGCAHLCRETAQFLEPGFTRTRPGLGFNSKDLCALALMPELISAGLDAIKIEGRMKSALYVATTASVYAESRRRILANGSQGQDLQDELDRMPHRAYGSGFLVGDPELAGVLERPGDDLLGSARMLGTIRHVEPHEYIAICLQWPLERHQSAELLCWDGSIHRLDSSRIRDIRGAERSGGTPNQVILLPWHPRAEPHMLVRLKTP